jgi:hypothetical protein
VPLIGRLPLPAYPAITAATAAVTWWARRQSVPAPATDQSSAEGLPPTQVSPWDGFEQGGGGLLQLPSGGGTLIPPASVPSESPVIAPEPFSLADLIGGQIPVTIVVPPAPAPTPTPTPAPAPAPAPTSTPTPAPAPTSTPTPAPAPTSTPTPAPAPAPAPTTTQPAQVACGPDYLRRSTPRPSGAWGYAIAAAGTWDEWVQGSSGWYLVKRSTGGWSAWIGTPSVYRSRTGGRVTLARVLTGGYAGRYVHIGAANPKTYQCPPGSK